jgi:hypothetical protein
VKTFTPSDPLEQIPARLRAHTAGSGAAATLYLPWAPTGGTNAKLRQHWSKRYADEGSEPDLQAPALVGYGFAGRPQLTQPVFLLWEVFTSSSGRLDVDNALGACKPMLDLIVRMGLTPTDSPRWIQSAALVYRDGWKAQRWTILHAFTSWDDLAAHARKELAL